MKKLVISAVFAVTVFSVQAGTVNNAGHVEVVSVSSLLEERVEVKPEDLPEKVKLTLNSKSDTGWKVIQAFLVTNDDSSQYYELTVRRADEITKMKLDKNGREIQ